MKIALEAIKVPLTIERGNFTPLLVGTQRLSARGRISMAEGDWELGGDSPLGLRIDADTEGTLECELQLRGEAQQNGDIQLWPVIDTLSVNLNRHLNYTEDGKTFALDALDLKSQEGGDVAKSVGVRLADTVAAAVTKLTSEAAASPTVARSALDLIADLTLDSLEFSIVDPVELVLSDQMLKVDTGVVRVTHGFASFADQKASAAVEIQLQLGTGTQFAYDESQLRVRDAQLNFALSITHEAGSWLVAPSADGSPGTLRVDDGELRVRDAKIQLSRTELTLGGLSLTDSNLAVTFEGSLRLKEGSADVGPTQLTFASGSADEFLVHLEGTSADQPTIDFKELRFEKVAVAVVSGESAKLDLRAERLKMESRVAENTPLAIQLENAVLEYAGDDARPLRAEAAELVLNIDAPGVVGLGALAPVNGATLHARWDSISIGEGDDALVLGPTGLAFQVNRTEPLDVDMTLHTANAEVIGERTGVIGDMTIKAGIAADRALSLGLILPFATMRDLLRIALPQTLEFEMSAKSLNDDFVKSLGLDKHRSVKLLRDHLSAKVALEGQHDMALAARNGALNLRGALSATVSVTVELGQYAKLLDRFAPAGDTASLDKPIDVARKRIPFDVDWTLDLSTNAPVRPEDFALQLRPVLTAPAAPNRIEQRIVDYLNEKAQQKPLVVPLGAQFGHQLAALDGLHVDTADIALTDKAVEVTLKATQ